MTISEFHSFFGNYKDYQKSKYRGYSNIIESIMLLKLGVPDYIANAHYMSCFRVTPRSSYIGKWIEHYMYNDYQFVKRPYSEVEDVYWYDSNFVVDNIYMLPAWSIGLLKALLPQEYQKKVKTIANIIDLLKTNELYYNRIINKFSKNTDDEHV